VDRLALATRPPLLADVREGAGGDAAFFLGLRGIGGVGSTALAFSLGLSAGQDHQLRQ